MHPGSVVADQFAIERLAGSGGMGTVYRAIDRHTGAPVALKVLHGRGAQDADRFVREAQLLAQLSHPGIVRYVAHGVTPDGERYLAIEWLDGESLGDRLARQGLTVEESLVLGRRVAEALAIAHRRGVVHRDLKPNNIFLAGGDLQRTKILDFGIARWRGGERAITLTGALLGTPGYIAPEQARGEREIDARADVFSLGCVLFKCLSGRPAFAGDDVLAVLLKVALEEVPRLAELEDDIPPDLDDLVSRMMSKRPADRPRDAAAVLEALAALGPVASSRAAPASVAPAALTTTERRVMCLVLARLGRGRLYTEERTLPPGEVDARAEALRELARRFGGALDLIADGSLLVAFTGSASDQAARAARCALAMRPLLPEVPMVVVTGRVVIPARLPIGDVIERGVRLLATGAAGAIRIDEVTAGLLDAQFEVGGDGDALALRAERDAAEATRTLLGKPTPCVGRDRELAALEATFEECVSEPVARAVVVTAAIGVGKSRLRYELLRRIRASGTPMQLFLSRGDPMSAGAPFGMLGSVVRRAAGVLDGEPAAVRRKKLLARIGRHLGHDDAQRVAEFLGELASVPFPDEDSVQLQAARADPMLMGDQMRRAWEDWLGAECAAQPVLLVLEDLHWGDLPTVKLVDAALRNLHDRPLMVLALARPEVDDLFPRLWAERPMTELKLGELTRRAAGELVVKTLGDVDKQTVARLVDRAGGNAFYLEELIRAVAAGKGDDLPDTILAMAQARLEEQEPDSRRVLRAASVFGQVFWPGGVAALLGGASRAAELSDWITVLAGQELVTRRGKGKFSGEDEYAFRHSLVREAAYAMLTDADRVLGHKLAASWLERVGEGEAVVLAEHLERGGEPARAVGWYRRAAEQALGGNDLAAALARVGRGVACGASGEVLGQLRLLEAEARGWRGEHHEALAAAQAARELLPREGPLWYGALREAALASGKLGLMDELIALADLIEGSQPPETSAIRALASASSAARQLFISGRYPRAERLLGWIERVGGATAIQSPAALASIHAGRAIRALCNGDPAAFLEAIALAAEAHERAGDLRSACLERVNLGGVTMEVGRYADAARALREGLAVAHPIGLNLVVAAAKCNLGLALARLGELDEGRRLEAEALALFVAQGERRMEGASRIYMAMILRLAGELDAAEQEARAAVEVLAVALPARACALATLADVLLAQGRAAEAEGAARRSVDLLETLGGIDEGESSARLAHARALDAVGDREGAEDAVARARDRVLERADKISDPAIRESFLSIPENAATLELARAWAVP